VLLTAQDFRINAVRLGDVSNCASAFIHKGTKVQNQPFGP